MGSGSGEWGVGSGQWGVGGVEGAMSDGHLTRETVERLARGELSPREQTEVRQHLEECAECTALTEEFTPPARWGLLAAVATLVMVGVLTLVAVRQC